MAAIASEAGGPKKVVSDVSAAVGGVMSASDPCSLPRSEQVTDIRQRQKKACSSSTDELAVVMHN